MSGKKICLIIALIFFMQFAQAFTMSLAKTDELCTANGSLTITLSNTIPGATVVFAIYRLPDATTPISVQSTTTLGGLIAGNYRVVATESTGSTTTTQQRDITILQHFATLAYQLTIKNTLCGNDGRVTVNVGTGNGPFQYEIFQGPMTFPLQSSNVFNGLAPGQYRMRVFDGCGEGVVQTFTMGTDISTLVAGNNYYNMIDCNHIEAGDEARPLIYPGGSVAYPITYQYTVYPPTGAPIVFPVHTITEIQGYPNYATFHEIIPYYYNQPNSYKIHVVDACNHTYEFTHQVDVHLNVSVGVSSSGCNNNRILINPRDYIEPYTVTFLQAPAGFNPVQGNPNHPGPFWGYMTEYEVNGNFGYYNIRITDACGRTAQSEIIVNPIAPNAPTVFVNQGCEEGTGGVYINPSGIALVTATIIAAPPQFQHPIPYLVPTTTDSSCYLGSLPAGNYMFQVTDVCGIVHHLPAFIEGYHDSTEINIIEHCGSFDVDLHHASNDSYPDFWLQKYNPVTNEWVHPVTGLSFPTSTPTSGNAIQLTNNTINHNFSYMGTFRIMKTMSFYGDGGSDHCQKFLMEFVFDGMPKINKVYSFTCANGSHDVIVDATGVAPLQYRIIEKDGQPFVVQNGNSYIFLGIAPGHYKFQVEDPCGNIVNSEFDVPSPFDFGITANNLCVGNTGSLVLPNFSILHYSWWKGNNTSTILSTTNELNFPSFSASDAGIYHVRVWYTGNPNSCLDFVLDYTITGDNSPHAGLDNAVSFCRNASLINLSAFLSGVFNASGTWSEQNNSGTITGNVWDIANLPSGIYHFTYAVESCNTSDEALITIEIKDSPNGITASGDSLVCEGSNVNLSASSSPNATYFWTGPNAFSSSDQNPIITNASSINSGTYTVVASIDDCASNGVPVTVEVNAVPDFIFDAKCEGGRYVVRVIPVDNSFDSTAVSYSWAGPNNYSNTANPIDITQLATGNYSVTVTDTNGCDKSADIDIDQTICFIPNVITPNNDDTNDNFDLTGFDVLKLEIYNRWGRKVYEKSNYIDEWHGQNMSGGILPDSTYYYIITVGTEEETKTGWIFLSKG